MRRLNRCFITFICIGVLISGAYYIRLTDYKVYCSITNTGADFRETDLNVIVYKPWNLDQTIGRIVDEYKRMNGVPNRLTLRLYHSVTDFKCHHPFCEAVFQYEAGETTDPPMAWN